jgi:transposase
LERVAVVITRVPGVRYHPGHVWSILHQRLGLDGATPPAAGQRARRGGIARWVAHEWPRIKRAAAESAWIVFFEESAVSLIPPVRRTWSPRGRTPILRHRFGWKKASMAAALGYRPDGQAARLCFHLQQPSYDTDTLIAVLDQLAGLYAGQRVVLIWDGLSAHWSTRMRAYLDSQHDWLSAERLPAYAHELNPVEYLSANLKDVELANLPTTTLAEVADAAHQGIQRVCKRDDLVVGFLAHTGLSLSARRSRRAGARQGPPRNDDYGFRRLLTWDFAIGHSV